MNPDDPDDQTLKRAMGVLRRADQRAAPPFEDMWQRARSKPPTRRASVRVLALGAPIVAAAAGVLLWGLGGSNQKAAPAASRPPASGGAVTAAVLPPLELDFLLREPAVGLAAINDFDLDPVSRRPMP